MAEKVYSYPVLVKVYSDDADRSGTSSGRTTTC
jgi:hypothetical protein